MEPLAVKNSPAPAESVTYCSVLDYGFVSLVDHMGDDLSVVRSARVSHNADWRAGTDTGSDSRLIAYLLKHRHTSPFESVIFTFEVNAPIFVIRQWQRHRTWSYNEVSARYTELSTDVYLPDKIGVPSKSNKQARDVTQEFPFSAHVQNVMDDSMRKATETYHYLLKQGVPREVARGVLPLNVYSRMFATVDLHNLLRFIHDRESSGAQWEMQEYARALRILITPIVPITMEHYDNLNPQT